MCFASATCTRWLPSARKEERVSISERRRLLLVWAAALLASIGFFISFPHRSDYLGHFLGGFGGTLGLLGIVCFFSRGSARWLVPGILAICILIGTYTEATIFRLAIFDPVDFFNQSLGASLAAVAALRFKGSKRELSSNVTLASGSLILGFYFAFA